MKTGNLKSLNDMAAELTRRMEAKADFIAPTQKLEALVDGGLMMNGLAASNTPVLAPTEHFRRQVSAHFKVPFEYSERIRAAHPELYAQTLNTFFQREPANRMVRTIDGKARAFLSDRYRPLDNHDLMEAILPALLDQPQIQIPSIDVSDNKFYLKAVFPKVQAEIRKGDVVQIGLVVSNSEVGAGSLSVMPMIYRLVCLNGMIMPDYGTKRTHIGRRNEADENVQQFLTDQTRRLDDAAFFAKTRDTVRGLLSELTLERIVQKMRDATEQPIPVSSLNEVVEVTAEKFGYTEKTKDGILAHLIKDGDFTRYGLMNALTRQSQDEEDYELATQLEADGGRIIELARSDWKRIAEAA